MFSVYQSPVSDGIKVFYPGVRRSVATRFLKHVGLTLLCTTVLCLVATRFSSFTLTTTSIQAAPAVKGAATTTPSSVTPQVPIAPAVVTPDTGQSCVPFGPVPAPSAMQLTTPGLQQLIDTPETYTIYGNDSSQITRQLQKCIPSSIGGSFSGATSYWLGTHYIYQLTPDAQCHLSDIAVGLHVTQVLPSWQGSGSPALIAKWEAYERNLILHENGHTVIDISEAQALLSDLQSMPAMPCDQIASAANTITNTHIAALSSANDTYDKSTGHGSLQGATW